MCVVSSNACDLTNIRDVTQANMYADEEAQDDNNLRVGFSLHARNLFLTYPHCNLQPDYAMELLLGALGRANILYAVVGAEQHQDGTPHLHAVILGNAPFRIRDAHALDLMDFHGNYAAVEAYDDLVHFMLTTRFMEVHSCWGVNFRQEP